LNAKSKFDIVNIDMMQDLPSQTIEDIQEDLIAIASLMPDSITWYTMRTNPDCSLTNEVSEEQSLEARMLITTALKSWGYSQTSGDRFCLNEESRDIFKGARNDVMMNLLGIGVSAYSHLDDLIFRNTTSTYEYKRMVSDEIFPVKTGKHYTPEEKLVAEFVLGLKDGIKLGDLAKTFLVGSFWSCLPYMNNGAKLTGDGQLFDFFVNYTKYRKKIPKLINQGYLEFNNDILQFTENGRLFENEICRSLYSPIIDAETNGNTLLAFFRKLFWDAHKTSPGFKASA